MQFAVVVTEECRVICRDFGADLHLIAGSGLKQRGSAPSSGVTQEVL